MNHYNAIYNFNRTIRRIIRHLADPRIVWHITQLFYWQNLIRKAKPVLKCPRSGPITVNHIIYKQVQRYLSHSIRCAAGLHQSPLFPNHHNNRQKPPAFPVHIHLLIVIALQYYLNIQTPPFMYDVLHNILYLRAIRSVKSLFQSRS